ncbi:MAG: VCBS repeat-containing protein, partial [Proteobacteria bacterium]
ERLEGIEVFGSLQKKVWEYKFSYTKTPKAGSSLLESVQICYPSGQCSKKTRYEYEGLESAVEESSNAILPSLGSQELSLDNSSRFVSDLNRDGFTDFIAIGRKQLEVSWGQVDGLSSKLESIPFLFPAGWKGKDNPIFIGELNGDGFPDLILNMNKGDSASTGLWVALGNGHGFEEGNWVSTEFGKGWNLSEDYISLSDLNLDGLSDVVGINKGGVHVALSDGKGSFLASTWTLLFDCRIAQRPANLRTVVMTAGKLSIKAYRSILVLMRHLPLHGEQKLLYGLARGDERAFRAIF